MLNRIAPLIIFFLPLIPISSPASNCIESWAEGGERAGDVFIQFAQEELGEDWSKKMSAKKYRYKSYSTPWEREIIASVSSWSAKDAREFLNILVNRLGKQNTCYLLARSLSHLKSIPHHKKTISQDTLQNFKERIALYDEYMGREKTTEMMRKSLAGFTQGFSGKIKEMIRFLEGCLQSKELVIRILQRDPQAFSTIRVSEIQSILVLLKTIISYEALREMMTRKKEDARYGRYLSLSKLKVLQIILQPLMNEVNPLKITNSLQMETLRLVELNYDHLHIIQNQVFLWIDYSGLQAVRRVMKKSFGVLFDEGFYRIGAKAKMAERESQDKKLVIKFAEQNPEFFARSNTQKFLENFRQWQSSSGQQSPAQQRPKHRAKRNTELRSAQITFSFPE